MAQETGDHADPRGPNQAAPVALGFRVHSGWAAVVAVAGSPRQSKPTAPAAADRRRIELVAAGLPAQPYHAAAELDLKQAEDLVKRSFEGATRLAQAALRQAVDELGQKAYNVVGCGVLLSSGRPGTSLGATLASHTLIHTAEGELFREAIAQASQSLHLPVTKVKERELYPRAALELSIHAGELGRLATEMGRPIGPPWRQDEKYAAIVGWLALALALRE